MANSKNEIVFKVPKILDNGDTFTICGNMKPDPDKLDISLLTGLYEIDYKNVVCHIESTFKNDNSIKISSVINGQSKEIVNESNVASQLFTGMDTERTEIKIIFKIEDGSIMIDIGASNFHTFKPDLEIKDISYLSLSYDILNITDLHFNFKN